jgi:hypothetical protein
MLTELKRFRPRLSAIILRTVDFPKSLWPFNAIYKSICSKKTVSSFQTSVFERRAFGILGVSLLTYLLAATSATAQTVGGFIEVCKESSITDPVTGNFTFTATNGSFTTGPLVVPVGACTGPIPIPAGMVTITEGPTSGLGVSDISASGYNPTTGQNENRLLSSNLTNRSAAVRVVAGGVGAATVSTETIAVFTNFKIPTGVLEVCKDAAPGTVVTGSFSFNVSGAANNPYVVPVGACSGPILVQAGSVTVTETARAGFHLDDVSTIPLGALVSSNLPGGRAIVTVAAGDVTNETVANFINSPATPGQLKICKIAGTGVVQGQDFTISANGVSHTVPAGPASQGGSCVLSGTFPVGTLVTVHETIPPGDQVLSIAVNPPDLGVGTPNLVDGTAQVVIGTGFTEVTFTNIAPTLPPTGQLKICKVAGALVAVGTNFTIRATALGSTQTYTVPAGPASEGGYCVVDATTFPLGTPVTLTEVVPANTVVTGITVSPASRGGTPGTNNIVATIGTGVTVATFTNSVLPPGSCQPSSSLSVLVTNQNVVAYVPKGNWSFGTQGISVASLEGSFVSKFISTTPDLINSCASNPMTGETLCTANNAHYYSLSGTSISGPLTSTGSGTLGGFSAGSPGCTNCGAAMDATDDYALIGLAVSGAPGFELLDLTPALPSPFFTLKSPSGNISEDPLIDPVHHASPGGGLVAGTGLILSASESNNYELVDISTPGSPVFYENSLTGLAYNNAYGTDFPSELDSSAEDCATGIALAPAEFSSPSQVVVADLMQAQFSKPAGSPPTGTWTAGAPNGTGMGGAALQLQKLTESVLAFGASGSSVAQGTHTGIISGEFGGGGEITAVALPTASGSGTPKIGDWVSCNIGNGFSNGYDPHAVTAYVSEGAVYPAGDAVAVLADWGTVGTVSGQGPGRVAVVDLTRMLNPAFVKRTSGTGLGHACLTAPLPPSVLSFVSLP